jgi:hypothetical protein
MVVFRAMGSQCRVVAPTPELAAYGQHLVEQLERAWNSSDPSSEISAVNTANGRMTVVSEVTYELLSLAHHAALVTGGAFDPLRRADGPTRYRDLSWGSQRDEHLRWDQEAAPHDVINFFPSVAGVCLRPGIRFEPGGMCRGLTGDLVA